METSTKKISQVEIQGSGTSSLSIVSWREDGVHKCYCSRKRLKAITMYDKMIAIAAEDLLATSN